MEKLKLILKKYFEPVNFAIVLTMAFLSCFIKIMFPLLMVYLLITSLFLKTEQILLLHIMLSMFSKSAISNSFNFKFYDIILLVPYLKNFIVGIVIEKRKVPIKPLLVLLTLTAYSLLKIGREVSVMMVFSYIVVFYLTIYFIFERRDTLNFKKIALTFCYSFLISCVLSHFLSLSELYTKRGAYFQDWHLWRFMGMFLHPNNLADVALVVFGMLMILFYSDKISLPHFIFLLIPSFVFGYKSLSRIYVLMSAIVFVVFAVLYIKKNGKNSISTILNIFAIFLALCLFFEEDTYNMIYRVKNAYEGSGYYNTLHMLDLSDPEVLSNVYAGKVHYDPGRFGLWLLYLKRIFESVSSFLIGYGVNAPAIGQMSAHNIILMDCYLLGIVGLALELLFVASMMNFKKVKKVKTYFPVIILVLAHLGNLMLNTSCTLGMNAAIIAYLFMVFDEKPKVQADRFVQKKNMIEKLYLKVK